MPRLDELKALLTRIDEADVKKPELFPGIVNEFQRQLMLVDDAMADLFGVSRPTITRWRNGSNVPYAIAREAIYRKFRREVKSRINQAGRFEDSGGSSMGGGQSGRGSMAAMGRS